MPELHTMRIGKLFRFAVTPTTIHRMVALEYDSSDLLCTVITERVAYLSDGDWISTEPLQCSANPFDRVIPVSFT